LEKLNRKRIENPFSTMDWRVREFLLIGVKSNKLVELDDFMAAKPITKTRNEEESRKKKKN
jgi:hypothetical protein